MGFICSGCFTQAQSETQYGIVIEKQLFTVWHTKSRQYILWAIRKTISIITLPKAPEGSLLPQQAFPLVSTGKSAPPPRSSLGQAVSAAKLPPTRSINTDGTDGLTWLSGQLFPTILTQLTGLHFYLFIYLYFYSIQIFLCILMISPLNPWFCLNSPIFASNFYLSDLFTDFLTALSQQSQ